MVDEIAADRLAIPFPEHRAAAILGRMVGRIAHLFRLWPDLAPSDLLSEALIAARAAWSRYDPAKAHQSTFIYTVGRRQVLDIWRRRSRGGVSHSLGDADPIDPSAHLATCAFESESNLDPLDIDIRAIRRAAESVVMQVPKVGARSGRTWFSDADNIVLGVWMLRRKLSIGAALSLLQASPTLRAELGLPRVPSTATASRARNYVKRRKKFWVFFSNKTRWQKPIGK